MTDYNSIASADIRKYLWDAIQKSKILNIQDYYVDSMPEPLNPIIPAQQIPEFNNLLPGRTYMFYDFEVKSIPVQWWMSEEAFTLTILSQNYEVINQISNLVNDLFRRYDQSATDLNTYFAGKSNFIYHHTLIDHILSPEPYNTEGDYQTGSVLFTYNYSRKTGADGRF